MAIHRACGVFHGRAYRGRSDRDGWDDFDKYDGEEDDSDDHDVPPSDLIESEIELRSRAGSRKPAAISPAVRDDELCYTRRSEVLSPFQSEYTSYRKGSDAHTRSFPACVTELLGRILGMRLVSL